MVIETKESKVLEVHREIKEIYDTKKTQGCVRENRRVEGRKRRKGREYRSAIDGLIEEGSTKKTQSL